jgi:hypothetical protein
MKIWKIAVVVTLAIALVLGVALPGLAASDEAAPQTVDCWPRLLRGEVTGVDDAGDPKSFDIQAGERELTIFVDENTRYFILQPPKRLLDVAQQRLELGQQDRVGPTIVPAEQGQLMAPERAQQLKRLVRAKLQRFCPVGEGASFSDIAVGDKVAVLLAPESERYLARVVTIIKPATYGRVSGTVTGVSEDSITIEPVGGGAEVTLEYNENTLFILKGIIMIDPEAEPFACAVYNTETTLAKVVKVWPEAPRLPKPSD